MTTMTGMMSMKILSLIMVTMETTDTFKSYMLGYTDDYDYYLVLECIGNFIYARLYNVREVGDVEYSYNEDIRWNSTVMLLLEKYNITFNLDDFSDNEKKRLYGDKYNTNYYFPWQYFYDYPNVIWGNHIKLTGNDLDTLTIMIHSGLTTHMERDGENILTLYEWENWDNIKSFIETFYNSIIWIKEEEHKRENTDLVYKHI